MLTQIALWCLLEKRKRERERISASGFTTNTTQQIRDLQLETVIRNWIKECIRAHGVKRIFLLAIVEENRVFDPHHSTSNNRHSLRVVAIFISATRTTSFSSPPTDTSSSFLRFHSSVFSIALVSC